MLIAKCGKCDNFVVFLGEQKCDLVCCGEPVKVLTANTTDAAQEKHVPEVTQEGNIVKVQVGSVAHPMLPEHYIEFIILETKQGFQKKALKPGDLPVAEFALTDGDVAVAAYEYCNLHGLWKVEL